MNGICIMYASKYAQPISPSGMLFGLCFQYPLLCLFMRAILLMSVFLGQSILPYAEPLDAWIVQNVVQGI